MPAAKAATSPVRAREQILLRLLGAFVGLLLVLGGPIGRQVMGLPDKHLSQWVMFRGIGLTLIDARFFSRDAQGNLERLDRGELLTRAPGETPLAFRRLRSVATVERMGRRLCSAVGPGADVRIVSRVATRRGWTPQFAGDVNVCAKPRGEQLVPGSAGAAPTAGADE